MAEPARAAHGAGRARRDIERDRGEQPLEAHRGRAHRRRGSCAWPGGLVRGRDATAGPCVATDAESQAACRREGARGGRGRTGIQRPVRCARAALCVPADRARRRAARALRMATSADAGSGAAGARDPAARRLSRLLVVSRLGRGRVAPGVPDRERVVDALGGGVAFRHRGRSFSLSHGAQRGGYRARGRGGRGPGGGDAARARFARPPSGGSDRPRVRTLPRRGLLPDGRNG